MHGQVEIRLAVKGFGAVADEPIIRDSRQRCGAIKKLSPKKGRGRRPPEALDSRNFTSGKTIMSLRIAACLALSLHLVAPTAVFAV